MSFGASATVGALDCENEADEAVFYGEYWPSGSKESVSLLITILPINIEHVGLALLKSAGVNIVSLRTLSKKQSTNHMSTLR